MPFLVFNTRNEKAGDDLQHDTVSLRLLLSSPDLVRIVPFYEVPGKRVMLSNFRIDDKLQVDKIFILNPIIKILNEEMKSLF